MEQKLEFNSWSPSGKVLLLANNVGDINVYDQQGAKLVS